MKLIKHAVTLASLLGMVALAQGQAQPGQREEAAPGAAPQEQAEVLWRLHTVNQNEIAMANLAKTNAESKEVKDYADQLAKDHQSADQQIQDYAQKNKISLRAPEGKEEEAQTQAREHERKMEELRGMTGRELDRRFLSTMVDEHDKAIKLVSDARDRFKGTDLEPILSRLQPVLERHRERAQVLERRVVAARRPAAR